MKKVLLGAVSALACISTPALAHGWSSTLGADYTYANAGGTGINAVGIDGLAAIPLNWDSVSLQANGDYHHGWSGPGSVDIGTVGGAAFWTGSSSRIAINGQYHMIASGHATTYGAGAEWFVAPDWTLALRGGGLSGSGGGNGGYVGGQVIKYWTPNFALSGGIDYTKIGSTHATDFSARGEWLAWDRVSLGAGYTFTDIPGVGINSVMVFLKFYCDGDGPSLVDHQRTGTATYISTYSPFVLKF